MQPPRKRHAGERTLKSELFAGYKSSTSWGSGRLSIHETEPVGVYSSVHPPNKEVEGAQAMEKMCTFKN